MKATDTCNVQAICKICGKSVILGKNSRGGAGHLAVVCDKCGRVKRDGRGHVINKANADRMRPNQ